MNPFARLELLFSGTPGLQVEELNGTKSANEAIANCQPDCSMIFLTRSEYQDLIYRAFLPELKSYKGKRIVIISDPT